MSNPRLLLRFCATVIAILTIGFSWSCIYGSNNSSNSGNNDAGVDIQDDSDTIPDDQVDYGTRSGSQIL
jgi:hypothetical protein